MTQTLVYQAAHRRVYRHSVIAGGVYSAEELSRARRIDPVVSEHYADFGEDVRTTQLSQDQLVYVSYRKADKVYWTKKKHLVCKGEAVVTDGKNIARSRCGNRLSKTPKLPVDKKNEPTETALNSPEPSRGNPGAHTGAPGDTNGLGGTGYQPETRAGGDGPGKNGLLGGDGNPGQTGASGPGGKTGASRNSGFGQPATYYPSYSPVFAIGPLVSRAATGTPGSTGTPTPTGTPTGTPTATTPEPESVVLVLLGGLGVWALRRKAFLR